MANEDDIRYDAVANHEVPGAASRPGTGFTRRAAQAVEAPVPGRVNEPDASDASAPPVIRAAYGTDLPTWLPVRRLVCGARSRAL